MFESMGIRELATRAGVAPHTLRYYEDAGLMIPVERDSARRRLYTEAHLKWVRFLLNLRESGMRIAQIREYVRLVQSDSPSDQQRRLAMLSQHRDEVEVRINRLTKHLAVIERKVATGCEPETRERAENNGD